MFFPQICGEDGGFRQQNLSTSAFCFGVLTRFRKRSHIEPASCAGQIGIPKPKALRLPDARERNGQAAVATAVLANDESTFWWNPRRIHRKNVPHSIHRNKDRSELWVPGTAMEDSQLLMRLQQLLAEDPNLGYRSAHAKLKEEAAFQDVAVKKVQTALQQLKAPAPASAGAGPGENLWTAASDGDVARVDSLMALEGFTPSSQDENGYTPVMAAASWGHVQMLSLLLQRQPSSVLVADADGDTALHHVAQATELEVLD
eukprot:s1080_g3.t1